jgi:Monooxygenase af470-like
MARADRRTVDLSEYPDLVVIYLGMRCNTLAGLKTMFGFGPKIRAAWQEEPDGLLLHEDLLFSPRHLGMREYWRDFESLEKWTRTLPHMDWWRKYVKDTGGTGFWHETYFMRGGMEAIYANMDKPLGLTAFAPVEPARGSMFSARKRLRLDDAEAEPVAAPYAESDLY